jgi:hypothetical protein
MMLSDARLQAVSSKNMYSLQGFDARIRPSAGQVCHSLMVVLNCTPGSAQDHAALETWSQSSLAGMVFATALDVRSMSCQSSSRSTASRKAFDRRTELLEFWPETVR